MSKPRIKFDRSNGAVCGSIEIPYFDDDVEGKLEVCGFGLNPIAALRKAAEVATQLTKDPMIAAIIPPQAMLVIKTARALTQLNRDELEQVAKSDDTAKSARKLASVLGELTIGARRRRQYGKNERGMPYDGGRGYTRQKGPYRGRGRGPRGPGPEVDQFGNRLDPYGNPVDEYGNPIPNDPYDQQYNPYAQPQLPPGYGDPYGMYPPQYPPYGMQYPQYPPQYPQYPPQYGAAYDPYANMMPGGGSYDQADAYFQNYQNDPYQQFAEQAWGGNAFAQQDDQYGGQYNPAYGQMADAGDVGDDGADEFAGCEPYCQ